MKVTNKSFHTNLDVDRNFDVQLLVCPNNVEPSEDRSFVVGGPTAIHFSILLNQLEGIRVPSVLYLRRLDVQMAVHTDCLKRLIRGRGITLKVLMGDAFSVSAGVVDLVTEVPRPENRLF